MSWLDELEARLERQLETFLQANPEQEALLADQATRDRLEQLRRNRLELQQQAEVERQSLLQLAVEIRQWQERVERARSAGAAELATAAAETPETITAVFGIGGEIVQSLQQWFATPANQALLAELEGLGFSLAAAEGERQAAAAPAGGQPLEGQTRIEPGPNPHLGPAAHPTAM